jgi:hypothetical protein
MTILTMPATPGFQSSRFGVETLEATFQSSLSFAQKSVLFDSRWRATYQLPPIPRDRAGEWLAFLSSLQGQAARFYAFDPDRPSPLGSGAGSPTVDGGGQTGLTLDTAGWTPSQIGVLKAGDLIAFDVSGGRRLKMLAADADADGDGSATLVFTSDIEDAPSHGTALITNKPSCVMKLDDQTLMWDGDSNRICRISFSALEVFR